MKLEVFKYFDMAVTKRNIVVAATFVVAVAICVYFAATSFTSSNRSALIEDPQASEESENQSLATSSSERGDLATIDSHADRSSMKNSEPISLRTITRSIYYSDRDFRDMAIDAVEREMEERRTQYPDGWLRWQAVQIDQNEITNGDYLDDQNIAKSFFISPFPDLTYKATLTEYRPRKATASATWIGVLDGGNSGTVKITIIANENGADLVIRLRTASGQFNISPTDVYGAYVSAETNAAFWSTQLTSQ